MPTKKPAKAPLITASAKRFSLVPDEAQQKMYKALSKLKPAKPGMASGADVAEIAVCLAIGEQDPVILACAARGARIVCKGSRIVRPKIAGANARITAATMAAIEALFIEPTAAAVICVGQLEAQEDYRIGFRFAARHKIPILFLVTGTLTGRRRERALSALDSELGVPVFSVDADDAIAAYRVATEALHNARHLRGPCIIRALTGAKGSSAVVALGLLQQYMERNGNWPL